MSYQSANVVAQQLRPEATAPAQARRSILAALQAWDLGELGDPAAILTSELVTNAVVHTRTAIELVIERRDHGIRVEVQDDDPALPKKQDVADVSTEAGRGLWLVDRLAHRWGTESQRGRRKAVWFELDVSAT